MRHLLLLLAIVRVAWAATAAPGRAASPARSPSSPAPARRPRRLQRPRARRSPPLADKLFADALRPITLR